MTTHRREKDSMGAIDVPADKHLSISAFQLKKCPSR